MPRLDTDHIGHGRGNPDGEDRTFQSVSAMTDLASGGEKIKRFPPDFRFINLGGVVSAHAREHHPVAIGELHRRCDADSLTGSKAIDTSIYQRVRDRGSDIGCLRWSYGRVVGWSDRSRGGLVPGAGATARGRRGFHPFLTSDFVGIEGRSL